MPRINGDETRPGVVVDHQGGLRAAVRVDHDKPGGGAFAQGERVVVSAESVERSERA